MLLFLIKSFQFEGLFAPDILQNKLVVEGCYVCIQNADFETAAAVESL